MLASNKYDGYGLDVTHHERTKVEEKIQSLICPSFVQENDVCDDSWLDGLLEASIFGILMGDERKCTSAGPAAIPLSTQAPMKLP